MIVTRITVTIPETLRELLDEWWAADPAGPPSDAERVAAQVELGLSR